LDAGRHVETEAGTPQGAVISPLLANVYLHYAYDLWVQAWRGRHATGDMIVIRYADDTIVGFQREGDAERFLANLKERLAKFTLELHPDKTRLIAFDGLSPNSRAVANGGQRRSTFRVHAYLQRRETDVASSCDERRSSRRWATVRRIGTELRGMGTNRSTSKAADWRAC
jgi:RNA-directed DNA polymerase